MAIPRRLSPSVKVPCAHCIALALCFTLTTLIIFKPAQAAQIHESDLSVSSQVGKVRTEAEGKKAESRALVHTVDIRREASTGEVRVTGKAGEVTTQAGGQNTNAASAVGGVSVGSK